MHWKCTRECDEYGHSDSCWMPVRTSPERKQKSQPKLSTFMPVDERGSQEKLANGEASLMGDRNRNLLNKKLTSSYETFSAANDKFFFQCGSVECPKELILFFL
uniref:Protocadherin-9 n=1 Tax=Cyanistes caeruleus TaxID=156563 RepID=A0A8C0VLM0_CYACU